MATHFFNDLMLDSCHIKWHTSFPSNPMILFVSGSKETIQRDYLGKSWRRAGVGTETEPFYETSELNLNYYFVWHL